jgi:Calx-beta domain/FG-GAP-like repeat/FG-GAP repeat
MSRGRALAVVAASCLACVSPVLAAVPAPVLKWSFGGCSSGPYCQTGWYSSPAVADLDGDGAAEVVWGAYDAVALNGESGSLKWRATNGQRVWPGVAVADLTGDGTLEVIVGRSGDQVTVYNRFGTVVWTRNPFGSGEVRTLAVADLETDGALEIVAGRASGGSTRQLNVFEPDGTVRPGWPARRDGEPGNGWGMYNENVAVADMNGDGNKEVFGPTDTHYITALDRGGNQLAASVVYGAGKVWSQVGVHVDHAVDLRGYANCGAEHRPNFADSAPIVADVNADGVPELVVVGNVYNCATDPYTSLYHMPFLLKADRTRWSGSGYDWTAIPAPGPGSGPRSEDYNLIETAVPNPVAADLDGDGRLEILFPSYDGKVHAYWLDKSEHGSWPYAVPATGSGGDTFRFASEPVVADLDGDGQAEVIFASWPKKGTGRSGHLHVLTSMGVELHRVALPAPAIGKTWNGGLGAPTLANIDADEDLEVVMGTSASGVVAFDLPGSAGARVLWRTGRGGYRRTGTTELPSLTIDDVRMTEGDGGTTNAVLAVRLSAASGQVVSVAYATADGSATAPADYAARSGPLSLPSGTTTVTVSVPVVGDLLDEGDETLVVRLSNAAGAIIGDAQASVTVVDDDPPPAIWIDDVTLAEGETGTTPAAFTLSLSAPSGRVVSVAAATADGTAVAGEDYAAAAWTVVMPPGVTAAPLHVSVRGDRVWEADESFVVSLSAPMNATLADTQGAGTIVNDDAQGLSIADLDVVEPASGTRSALFTVTLSPPSAGIVTVGYSTSGLTAAAGSDYESISGTLTFDPGVTTRSIAVTVRADALAEGVETFRVDLSGPSGAAIAHGQAVGRIHDQGKLFPVAPCRVLDTRDAAGAYGRPPLAAGQSRSFTVAGRCGIPASATAVAVNLAVTQPSARGNLRLYPADGAVPPTATLNYAAGQTRANNAIIGLSPSGALAVRCTQASGTAHIVLDVTGYFE